MRTRGLVEPSVASQHLSPSHAMCAKFLREVTAVGLPRGPGEARRPSVTDDDLEALPAPARQFMRFARVVGRPRDWSFCARWDGRFRMAPDADWMACEVWQYDTNVEVARIFHMRMWMGHVLPTYIRDLYVHGGGRMLGKVLDAIPVVDDARPKVTIGELVTYLNDAVLFAPSMLLDGRVAFHPIDDRSFEVSLTDHEQTVTACVFVDEGGAPTDFWTTDRFGRDPASPAAGLVRTRWSTPVAGWRLDGDRARPVGSRAIWHFPSGDFCYAELDADRMDLRMNVPPGEL